MAESWCNQEARAKDKLETTLEPNLDVRGFLETAYLHPAIKAALAVDLPTLGKGGIHNLLESGRSLQLHPPREDTPRNQDGNSIVSQSVLLVPKSRWGCCRVMAGSTLVELRQVIPTLDWAWPWSMWIRHVATFFPEIISFVSNKTTPLQYSAPIHGTVRSDPCNNSSWWTTWVRHSGEQSKVAQSIPSSHHFQILLPNLFISSSCL